MFEAIAKLAEKTVPHKKTGQHRATWATGEEKPLETAISRRRILVAQNLKKGQQRKTAENGEFSASVAHVAHVAQENEQSCKWDKNDWRTFYEERAGVLEHDEELERADAERQAYETTVIQWMNETPPKGIEDDHCASCGHSLGDVGKDAVPFLTGGSGHVWLHYGCHGAWMARRRADANKALGAMGIGRS